MDSNAVARDECLPCLLQKGQDACSHCGESVCDVCTLKFELMHNIHCRKCYGPCKEVMETCFIPTKRGYLARTTRVK